LFGDLNDTNMNIKDFAVERYFAKYEFKAKYLLSSSDCDGFPMNYLLGLASSAETECWDTLRLGYTETKGSEPLRHAISQHYEKIGLEDIVVCSPGEANFSLMNVLLKRGDHVVCMAPMYQSMYQVAKTLGCKLSFWKPEVAANNGWYYDPSQLEALITEKTKLLVVNFPHNPTGYSPSAADLDAIVAIARKRGVAIFSDEMYRFLVHSPACSTTSLCDIYENAVSLWGTAKTFGLGGLRLGWLTSQNRSILDRVEAFKDYLSICNSAPSEVLGTIALNNTNTLTQINIEKIRRNIQIFKAFSVRNADFLDFYEPVSGSTAFVRLKIKERAMDFSERLVSKTGIMLLPSETFEYGTKHARIGFGRENLPEILGILEGYIRAPRSL
jgi:aspartate/methionine/tyrosine aminotransferase